jgi:transcription termination factor Rho
VTGKQEITTAGVLKMVGRGAGVLVEASFSFQPLPDSVQVPASLIREFGLVEGASLEGVAQSGKQGVVLQTVKRICGLEPAAFRKRTLFPRLVAVDPHDRFDLGATGDTAMRVVDLVAPIAKGTRGLIVSPPKSGKTRILEEIARGIAASEPSTRIIMLLIDERPEEVTHMRRTLNAEVIASSNDRGTEDHIILAELVLAHVRCELESGQDVVILVDSLTRLARAVNLRGKGSGRTLSGGVDAAALEMPRRFFGLARNIEKGGSVTVIGTALVGTGSLMDDLLFEEFKATGNSELMLDRELAEARLFPAINVHASSTRREELLYDAAQMEKVVKLRRWMANKAPKEALEGLLKLLAQTKSNEELLRRIK